MRQVTRGVTSFSASRDGALLLVPLSGRLFLHDRARRLTRELDAGEGAIIDPRLSPCGELVAFVRQGDLHTLEVASGAVVRLTRRDSPAIEHGLAEFVAQEEMNRMRGHWWSPDGQQLAYQRTDASCVETLWVHDATRPEEAPTPFRYPRAGANNAEVELGVAPARGGQTVWVKWDRLGFPYLCTVRWQQAAPLTIVVMDRAQRTALVLAVDPRTGASRELVRETDPVWLNLDQSMPRWLPDGSGFLWSSERGGAWQLELRGPDGALVRPLTGPELGYQGLAGLDRQGAHAWIHASADPRRSQVARVAIEGGVLEPITTGDGSHQVILGRDEGTHVLVSSEADGVTRWSVRRPDGGEIGQLPAVAEAPPQLPALELTTVQVDGRLHHASVVRPRAFDGSAARRYPVLLYVYGGPHTRMVVTDPRAYLLDQWYADAGFIVVRTDGRGTPYRGRAWERAVHGDLCSAALDDQVAVLRGLGAARPEMDLDQVGVYGWSFGGYLAAMAVLRRPEVFRAAVAGAPVTDWRDYDTFYTERYMGLPDENPEGYRSTSCLPHAGGLERPLLLVHGTTDDNVYFSHSLKLAQALFRAGRHFEMLPLAGLTHMVPDPAVKKALVHRIVQFLRAHLQPPR
jgi:dipeptidyl-peptidase 4